MTDSAIFNHWYLYSYIIMIITKIVFYFDAKEGFSDKCKSVNPLINAKKT